LKDTISIYNHYHNGDVFYSRVLIKILSKKFNINYYHNLPPFLLSDLDNLNEIKGIPEKFPINDTLLNEKIINSWIGQQGRIFINFVHYGCCFENYLGLCNQICEFYGIDIDNYEDILPSINYIKLPNIELIENKCNIIMSDYEKKVLISNGNVNSGQSLNFDFHNVINTLSTEFSKILFLTTEPINSKNNNVICTDTITEIKPDLLQISYISTKCDIIIGRASGPYCFSQVKENLMDPNKTFISFCDSYHEGKYYDKQNSKFIWSNNYNEENIIHIIRQNLIN